MICVTTPRKDTSLLEYSPHRWCEWTIQIGYDRHSPEEAIRGYLNSLEISETSSRLHALHIVFEIEMRPIVHQPDSKMTEELKRLATNTPLRVLSMQGIETCFEPAIYNQLTELTLSHLDPEASIPVPQMEEVLSACRQLRKLRLIQVTLMDVPRITRLMILLYLEELTVFQGSQDHILRIINAPRLEYLAVETDDDDSNKLLNFVRRSPRITTLRLCSPENNEILAALITRLNNVEVLIIGDEGYRTKFVETEFLGDIPLHELPKLSELRLELGDITYIMEPIQRFVEARERPSAGRAAIRTVSFDCLHNHQTEDAREHLRQWFASRVNVECWRFRDVLGELDSPLALRCGIPCKSGTQSLTYLNHFIHSTHSVLMMHFLSLCIVILHT